MIDVTFDQLTLEEAQLLHLFLERSRALAPMQHLCNTTHQQVKVRHKAKQLKVRERTQDLSHLSPAFSLSICLASPPL